MAGLGDRRKRVGRGAKGREGGDYRGWRRMWTVGEGGDGDGDGDGGGVASRRVSILLFTAAIGGQCRRCVTLLGNHFGLAIFSLLLRWSQASGV